MREKYERMEMEKRVAMNMRREKSEAKVKEIKKTLVSGF